MCMCCFVESSNVCGDLFLTCVLLQMFQMCVLLQIWRLKLEQRRLVKVQDGFLVRRWPLALADPPTRCRASRWMCRESCGAPARPRRCVSVPQKAQHTQESDGHPALVVPTRRPALPSPSTSSKPASRPVPTFSPSTTAPRRIWAQIRKPVTPIMMKHAEVDVVEVLHMGTYNEDDC